MLSRFYIASVSRRHILESSSGIYVKKITKNFSKTISEAIFGTLSIEKKVTSKTSISKKPSLGILGVPFSKGQCKEGVEKAPTLLRQHNLIEHLVNASSGNLDIRDYGDLQFTADSDCLSMFPHIKNYAEFMGCNKALIKKIPQILNENDQFLTIGGDHCIGFGSVSGHLQHTPNLSVVWIDAHADINLHMTSGSGNIHGMPVSLLLKELRQFWSPAHLDKIAPVSLSANQLVYIGLRDIDPYEAYILKELNIKAYAMDTIDKIGLPKIVEMTLDALNIKNKIHVSFDIDAMCPTIAPSTGTTVSGGLTLQQGIHIVQSLRDTNRVQGVDLVEVNPLLGDVFDVGATLTTSLEILKAICGHKKYQTESPDSKDSENGSNDN